ncbi:MAG: hypothetical protein ACJAZP_001068 [Psychromonas sp.]|jgi:hypothetical protein
MGETVIIVKTATKALVVRQIPFAKLHNCHIWEEYTRCMELKLTLREATSIYNINLKTAFLWRHRFLIASSGKYTDKLCSIIEVDICFQDEARFGQQNTTTRLWAEKGTRPRPVKHQQFEYAYLFGAICPAAGATDTLIAPYIVNKCRQVWNSVISDVETLETL